MVSPSMLNIKLYIMSMLLRILKRKELFLLRMFLRFQREVELYLVHTVQLQQSTGLPPHHGS